MCPSESELVFGGKRSTNSWSDRACFFFLCRIFRISLANTLCGLDEPIDPNVYVRVPFTHQQRNNASNLSVIDYGGLSFVLHCAPNRSDVFK